MAKWRNGEVDKPIGRANAVMSSARRRRYAGRVRSVGKTPTLRRACS
ncbi:MAG: hypothetical protein ABDI19_09145 [Armatimonadota bacterium]